MAFATSPQRGRSFKTPRYAIACRAGHRFRRQFSSARSRPGGKEQESHPHRFGKVNAAADRLAASSKQGARAGAPLTLSAVSNSHFALALLAPPFCGAFIDTSLGPRRYRSREYTFALRRDPHQPARHCLCCRHSVASRCGPAASDARVNIARFTLPDDRGALVAHQRHSTPPCPSGSSLIRRWVCLMIARQSRRCTPMPV